MEINNYTNCIITTDEETGCLYFYLKPKLMEERGWVSKTISLNESINIDIDQDGEIGGIEFVTYKKKRDYNNPNSD